MIDLDDILWRWGVRPGLIVIAAGLLAVLPLPKHGGPLFSLTIEELYLATWAGFAVIGLTAMVLSDRGVILDE